MKLQGIFCPVATPFDHRGEIWQIKVLHNIDKWNRTGLAGYVVCGRAGEGALLEREEKRRMWSWVAEYAASDKLLIAATGAESVRETVALTNEAADLGYKAALVKAPHYYKEAQPKLYFGGVADGAKIPVVMTGVDGADAVAELSHHPNIIAVEESAADAISRVSREAKPGFQVLASSGTAEALAAGATGVVLALANAAPYAAISIWEAHRTREFEAALEWQNRIERAAQLVTTEHGVGGLKYAMDLAGYYGGAPRLPLAPPCPQARRDIEEAFADLRG